MFFKKRYINNSMKRAMAYIKANYYKLSNIDNGDCPYNHRCHINAVQRIKKHKWHRIYWCYQLNDETIIAHFVNYGNNKHIETTQWRAGLATYDYYIVREFKEDEFMDKIDWPLESLKRNIFNISFTNKFLNKIFDIKRHKQF